MVSGQEKTMLDKDMVMHIANATAGRYWMNEAHVQAFANAIAELIRTEDLAICEDIAGNNRWSDAYTAAEVIKSKK